MSFESASPNRGRGRGRGNRGKYLRARGRRGLGRAAEFTPRLLLEEEQGDLDEDEDDQVEDLGKYAKRGIIDNSDRFAESEIDPNVEEEPEPEVDLSAFLAKQQLKDDESPKPSLHMDADEEDIDHALSSLSLSSGTAKPRKNNTQTIQWDASMEELKKEKEAAEAVRDLKSRFRRGQSRPIRPQVRRGVEKTRGKVEDSRHEDNFPSEEASDPSTSKVQMEDFLDDLLS